MKNLLNLFAALLVAALYSNFALGQSFTGEITSFSNSDPWEVYCRYIGGYDGEQAVWLPKERLTKDLCFTCLMVSYDTTSEIYPITDLCDSCEKNEVSLSRDAFLDFDDPDEIKVIYGANFTFVNCDGSTYPPTTPDPTISTSENDISTEVSTTFETETKSSAATLTVTSHLKTTSLLSENSTSTISDFVTTNKISVSPTTIVNSVSPSIYHINYLKFLAVIYVFSMLLNFMF